jgi:hypothetical protein
MVATPSKLRSRDAVAAGVISRLDISRIGAMRPPARIARMSQGTSGPLIAASPDRGVFPAFDIRPRRNIPTPVPKYRKATRKTGEISPTRIFERGVLIPNKVAARRAYPMGDQEIFTISESSFNVLTCVTSIFVLHFL